MNITLSDFSDGMVEYLRKHYLGMGISVRKIDILDIPFEKDTFDLIIANSMLYHVKDIDSAISEVKRVLKKSGLFYCATFGMNGMTQYLYHALFHYFDSRKVNGYLHVPKEYGMFVSGNA